MVDTFLKAIFGLSFAGGTCLVGWGEFSYYLDSENDIYERKRVYYEMGSEFFSQEIEKKINAVKGKIDKIDKGCKERIRIIFPKSITRTRALETGFTRDDEESQRIVTGQTYTRIDKSWIEVLEDNLNDHDELINYSKIFKRACEIYRSGNEKIKIEYGKIPQTYRLFGWTGLTYKWGFRITNGKFKHILYGSIDGDYQTTNSRETNIDRALSSIN